MVHELEVEGAQETWEGKIETVSVDSVHLSRNWSLITAHLQMQAGKNIIEIPYKIDTGSEGNIMSLYILKNCLKIQQKISLKIHKKPHKASNIQQKNITQLGTCAVIIKLKNVLLGMPDMAALNIINLNIDSIQAEVAECTTNIRQEMQIVSKGCAKMATDDLTTQNTNSQNGQANTNKSINYFLSSDNVDADKRKSSAMMQKIHDTFGNVFNGIGCFKGTFSLQLKPDSKPYQVPPGMWCMYYKTI